MLTSLRLSGLPLGGLLVNLNCGMLKDGIRRRQL